MEYSSSSQVRPPSRSPSPGGQQRDDGSRHESHGNRDGGVNMQQSSRSNSQTGMAGSLRTQYVGVPRAEQKPRTSRDVTREIASAGLRQAGVTPEASPPTSTATTPARIASREPSVSGKLRVTWNEAEHVLGPRNPSASQIASTQQHGSASSSQPGSEKLTLLERRKKQPPQPLQQEAEEQQQAAWQQEQQQAARQQEQRRLEEQQVARQQQEQQEQRRVQEQQRWQEQQKQQADMRQQRLGKQTSPRQQSPAGPAQQQRSQRQQLAGGAAEDQDHEQLSPEYDDGPEHNARMAAMAGSRARGGSDTPDQRSKAGSKQEQHMVDLAVAAAKLREGLRPDPDQYLEYLEASHPKAGFPENLGPSVLEAKLKAGKQGYKSVLQPTWAPDGQGFLDLQYDDDGLLAPLKNVWQFQLSFVKAINVGTTGFGKRRLPLRHVARVCIFDRQHHRFLGNVFPVLCTDVRSKEVDWVFNPANSAIVRCGQVQPSRGGGCHKVEADKLSLYVELNVAFKLSAEDAKSVPQSEYMAGQLSEELCTCWALINLRRCCELARELEVAVPLYYGSIYDPQLLHNLAAEKRRLHPIKTLFASRAPPVLKFRVAPLAAGPEQAAPVVAYHHMPPTMIAHPHVAYALGAYRLLAAQHLATGKSPLQAFGDAVMCSFPQLAADQQLLAEFLARWHVYCSQLEGDGRVVRAGCSPQRGPGPGPVKSASPARVVAAFQRCTLELAPLLECLNLPMPHMSNFIEYQVYRAQIIRRFCTKLDLRTGVQLPRHPAEPLSTAEPGEYLHKPFSVAQTRMSMADSWQ